MLLMLSLKLLLSLAIAVISITVSHPLDTKDEISLNQFDILKCLGSGVYGSVYLTQKNVGSDNGTLYALKSIHIPNTITAEDNMRKYRNITIDMLNNEREVLETVKGTQWATGLHYAFHQGIWLFIVMDLGIGGTLENRTDADKPEAATAKLIIAEMISAVEELHKANLLHADLHSANFVINHKGHLLLTDFGCSLPLIDKSATYFDWLDISMICHQLFYYSFRDENEQSLVQMMQNMTDDQLPQLKSHPYFDGIKWEMVATRESEPPYDQPNQSIEAQIVWEDRSKFEKIIGIGLNDTLESSILGRLQNYPFVAPEYRN